MQVTHTVTAAAVTAAVTAAAAFTDATAALTKQWMITTKINIQASFNYMKSRAR